MIVGFRLFIKYIEFGSPFEINISYNLRKQFIELMRNYDEWMDLLSQNDRNSDCKAVINRLLLLFLQCNHTNYKLMKNSYKRFQTTPEFLKLKSLLFLDSSIA